MQQTTETRPGTRRLVSVNDAFDFAVGLLEAGGNPNELCEALKEQARLNGFIADSGGRLTITHKGEELADIALQFAALSAPATF